LLGEKGMPLIANTSTELEHWLFLHEQRRIVAENQQTFRSSIIVDEEKGYAAPPSTTHPVVQDIMALDGVQYCVAVGYQLVVIKGGRFGWDQIEPDILLILQATQSSTPDDLESLTFESEEDFAKRHPAPPEEK
jgi:hypothetical protein